MGREGSKLYCMSALNINLKVRVRLILILQVKHVRFNLEKCSLRFLLQSTEEGTSFSTCPGPKEADIQ